jgi:HSP20 family protein
MASERDLFANFERMRREIDELFGDVFERTGLTQSRAFTPEVDVYYCGGGPARAIVRPQEAEGRLYQQIEIANGPFKRVIELSADVDAERAAATYDDGVLRIDIPLAQPEDSTRRIPIEGAEQ